MPSRPSRSEPGIDASIVDPVVAVLAERGFTAKASLPRTPAGVVDGPAADRFLDAAASALGDDALGLSVARSIPIGSLGIVDYALCTSSTLGDAFARVARHYGVATQRVRLGLVAEGERARLVFVRAPDVKHSRHWMEFSFAIVVERMRQTVGVPVELEDVSFRHAAPSRTRAHDAFFGVPVRFGQTEDGVAFSRSLLARPLRTASSALAEVLDRRLDAMDPQPAGEDDVLTRTRTVVGALLARGDTRLASAASRLHVSVRTLQRELSRRGTSHAEVLDDVRRREATALLAQSRTVAEVARRLAYADPSAFFRAFRRWTGESPRGRPR